jgi:hypothetical protein
MFNDFGQILPGDRIYPKKGQKNNFYNIGDAYSISRLVLASAWKSGRFFFPSACITPRHRLPLPDDVHVVAAAQQIDGQEIGDEIVRLGTQAKWSGCRLRAAAINST